MYLCVTKGNKADIKLRKMYKIQNLQPILDAAESKINEMVASFKEWHLKEMEREATNYDIEMYKIGIVSDFIGAFGRYIYSTDNVVFKSVSNDKGVLVFTVGVVREGVENYLSTRVIIAGGHNIQCRHYRYLVDTNLKKISFDHPAVIALKNERKRMTAEQRVKEDIKRHAVYAKRTIDDVKKEMNKQDDEIVPGYLKLKYEDLNEYAKSNWTKEQYQADRDKQIQECIASHKTRYSERMLNAVTKERAKELAKLEAKLQKLSVKLI